MNVKKSKASPKRKKVKPKSSRRLNRKTNEQKKINEILESAITKKTTPPIKRKVTHTPDWLKPTLHSYVIPLKHFYHLSAHGNCSLRRGNGSRVSRSNIVKRVPKNVYLWSHCPVGYTTEESRKSVSYLMDMELNKFRKKIVGGELAEGVFLQPGDEYLDNHVDTVVNNILNVGLYYQNLGNIGSGSRVSSVKPIAKGMKMTISEMLKEYVEPNTKDGSNALVVLDCCRVIIGPNRNGSNESKHGQIIKVNNYAYKHPKYEFVVNQKNLNSQNRDMLKEINRIKQKEYLQSLQFLTQYGFNMDLLMKKMNGLTKKYVGQIGYWKNLNIYARVHEITPTPNGKFSVLLRNNTGINIKMTNTYAKIVQSLKEFTGEVS